MPRAFISGVTGQTGSYLAELLLSKGYEVHGLMRRVSSFSTGRIDHIWDQLHMHHGDLADGGSLTTLLQRIQPDEVFNLGAMSHVRVSFDAPEYTADVTGTGAIRMLEAVREARIQPRYYQASSSEMFGSSPPPQNENTPFHPRSPYGCAKVFAYWATVNYRESYGLHASNGILFNHESPRRGETFVTRKITRAVARIKAGLQDVLALGNVEAKRDWGHARDYAEAMWLMLQQPAPGDYVIATGEMHTVAEFAKLAFEVVDLNWMDYTISDSKYFRPAEVDALCGDSTKARKVLGWQPKVSFTELVYEMVMADIQALERPR
jgi:GDPmannose 4,6-dehydratase